MRRNFFGGLLLPEFKDLSMGQELRILPPPAHVVLPMSQHIGGMCSPMVKVGDRVLLGQKIGQGGGLCAPIHASISGQVDAVEPRPHPNGTLVLSVVISNDFKDEKCHVAAADWQSGDTNSLLDAIDQAGIVGMGGATFPTAAKIRASLGRVDTLLVNACECEPYITADDCLLCLHPMDVVEGARHMAQILKPQRIVLAVEENKAHIAKALRAMLRPPMEVVTLPTRYPQGAEKQLVQAITGRQVPPGCFPPDVGCMVANAGTCAAVCRALEEGTPIYERIVTVTGQGVSQPQNFLVRLGTSFLHVLTAAGGITGACTRVISGGPMMGVAQTRLDVPVCKGTNAILCLTDAQLDHAQNPTCIRCGRCIEACPMQLEPVYLHQFYVQNRLEKLQVARLSDCIECGCCAYVCPGKLPLVEQFRAGKTQLRAAKQEGTP